MERTATGQLITYESKVGFDIEGAIDVKLNPAAELGRLESL